MPSKSRRRTAAAASSRSSSEEEERDEGTQHHQRLQHHPDYEKAPRGKGDSSLAPTQKPKVTGVEWKLGAVMFLSLPLALLVFWFITLPLMSYCVVSLLGDQTVQQLWYLKQDMTDYLTSECPLWMSSEERAYLEQRSQRHIRRVSKITREEFTEYVSRGEPVIITDAIRDWDAFGKFNCEYLIKNYPDAEYFDWQGQEQITLGNITNRAGYDGIKCASGYMEMFLDSNAKYVKEWLSQMKLPYFYPEDHTMESAFNDVTSGSGSPPMTGFLGVPGTGVSPHLDETCDNFMTVQLSGIKTWSLSWPVRDGDRLQWSKPLVFTLYPGEALLWYVSMQHHTEVVEDCSLSFSFQMKYPPPTDYFNRLVQDLSAVDKAERDRLYQKTHTSNLDFIDSCKLQEFSGKVYIT